MLDLVNGWAAPALQGLARVGDVSLFGWRAVTDAFRRPFEIREIVRQIGEVGLLSLPLIAASGLAVGAVMSMHTRATLARFGAEASIPAALAIALVRETGPLVTALLVSGRVGAAIGAELGAMRVTEQIDALESLAVDSFKYLAVTRIVACTLALPILTTVMNFSGMLGGFLAEHWASGMSLELYFRRAFAALEFTELIPATLKTTVFGFIIGTLSSYLGYGAAGGSAGVGRASTQSVVYSSICLILANVLLVRTVMFILPD
jgi:phospholipid/cholesterol/gamma-HCH transport system permease protein